MLIIDPSDNPIGIAVTMQSLEERYVQTKNPIYPIYAFRHCFQRGATPPEWVMQYVAVSFHDYLLHSGTKTIDDCLQLKIGKGKTPPFKLFLLEERDDNIMWDMFRLVEYMDCTVEDAAAMVKAKLEAAKWDKTNIELSEPSDETIRDMYRKSYRKQAKHLALVNPSLGDYFSVEKRKTFLATFPEYSIPLGLK